MKKEKYLQIFRYLCEFSKIRDNPVRNIEVSEGKYPEKVWFEEILKSPFFECITFPDFNEESEYWIKIRKPAGEPIEPSFRKLSKVLDEWINPVSLLSENDIPILNTTITKNGEILELDDFPQVRDDLQQYIETKWLEDLIDYKSRSADYQARLSVFQELSSIYKRFFGIFNKAEQFGEEYELVVGIGLLNYKQDDNCPHIYRHLLTAKVEISFEYSERESFLTVSPSTDSKIIIEKDAIIDLVDQFESQNIIDAENIVVDFLKERGIVDDLFDKDITDALRMFAERCHSDGEFNEDSNRPKGISKKPIISFSPALLLRKRNTRSFTALYEKIIDDLRKADDINIPSLNDLIGYYEEQDEVVGGHYSSPLLLDEPNNNTIYFPKKFNDEQVAIVQRAQTNDKVLVQGPPGTGKSHTIANLICHLLAQGKRILVTAQKEQALSVLKEQLPTETRNLAVTLMGGDTLSIQDMEASVNAITEGLAACNIPESNIHIQNLEKNLSRFNEQIAETTNELLKIKEKSTRKQVVNEVYQGTLLQIAERLETDAEVFKWFQDSYCKVEHFDIANKVKEYVRQLEYYEKLDCSAFDRFIPNKENLISVEKLQIYRKVTGEIEQRRQFAGMDKFIDCSNLVDLKKNLKSLLESFISIEKNTVPCKSKLISEYALNISNWKKRIVETDKLLSQLSKQSLGELDQNIEILYPNNKSLIQLKNDARRLLEYLNEGNYLAGIFFNLKKALLPKDIKEKLYFISEVKVNGSDCDSITEFEAVLKDLEIKQTFERLVDIWELQPEDKRKNYLHFETFYTALKEETTTLIKAIEQSIEIKANIELNSNVRIYSTDSAKIEELVERVDLNLLLKQEKFLREKLSDTLQHLGLPNSHIISNILSTDLNQLDIYQYELHLSKLEEIRNDAQKYREFKRFESTLQEHLPLLLGDIILGILDRNEINNLKAALCFRNAQMSVSKMLRADFEEELLTKLDDFEHERERVIEGLATRKAWLHVLVNLQSNRSLRQYLEAWVMAVRKIGKTGKGKRALKFRKIAQSHMEQCKDSIPCWIMPLYKVAETINPEAGMYDYVIIDEASQLGPDAIFLLYISKNVIIVGDDKQTSPEYVGVDANTMTPHINQHLQGIPFADHYDTNFSFFDHAKLFCAGLIVLREHFRCMPEIIEFSNKYFYAPEGKGLYPLKQYLENRLEPLKNVFCSSGYTSGQYQNIINVVEAQAIADKITELSLDERYDGKTFGIIALQGNAQAALINNLLLKKIDEKEYRKRNIKYGNSAAFQGDERDVMFLSLVTAHNHNRAPLVKPEDERRFNVAVSRAKEQIWLFHSIQIEDLSNNNDLRYKLLDHFLNCSVQKIPTQQQIRRTMGTQPSPFESWFEVDIFNDIVAKGYQVIPQYEVARGKYRIDLVSVLPNGRKIAIECDGDKFHGTEQYENDLMRQRVLERCGWQFFRIRGGEYYSDRRKSLEPLWDLIGPSSLNEIESEPYKVPVIINEELASAKFANGPAIPSHSHSELFENGHSEFVEIREGFLGDEGDFKVSGLESFSSISEFLVFTSKFNVYKVKNQGFTSTPQILDGIDFEPDEKIIYLTGTKNYLEFLIVAFTNGKIGKVRLESYQTEFNRRKLRNAHSDESPLVFIELFENDLDLVAISNINKVILFNTSQINSVSSRVTTGVKVMNSKDGSYMSDVKKVDATSFQNVEYYRKNIPAIGNYLLQGDNFKN
ncbi:MAG TPA: AAA domain-containing protein [Pyrinomonadaceae bacterium]|jgi:very-short-patch-repair endonuclease|nr:AAA domain-containing protein [Pyrinomonadaceae bacterium]